MMRGQQRLQLQLGILVQVHWQREQGIKGDRHLLDLCWWRVVVLALVMVVVFHDVDIRDITRKRINNHLDLVLHRWLARLEGVKV